MRLNLISLSRAPYKGRRGEEGGGEREEGVTRLKAASKQFVGKVYCACGRVRLCLS